MNRKTYAVPKFYFAQVRRYPKQLTGLIVMLPITVLVNQFLPQLIVADSLRKLSQHSYTTDQIWTVFGWPFVIYFVLLSGGIGIWRIVDRLMWRLEGEIGRDIAQHVFRHLVGQTTDFHANNFSGSLVSQTNKLLSGYVKTADTTIFQVYPMLLSIVLTNVILLSRAPLFVAALDIFATLYLAIAMKISKRVQRASADYATVESAQTGFLADAITNVTTIKSYARGKYEDRRFAEATDKSYHKMYEFAAAHRQQMNRLGLMARTISSTSLALAVISVIAFHTNLGTMFLILSYTSRIVDQLFEFSNGSLRSYARSWGDAADMVEMLAVAPKIVDPKQPSTTPISDGSIAFNNVHFQHEGSSAPLFTDLNITIMQGEKVGLVGHSGSGKTTLSKLLLRFSDIDSGSIVIGGQNIAEITQDALHESIGYVPQEPLLFHRSIGENIAYGKEAATQAEIEKAASDSHAKEFIDVLPKGYDTLVGERGVKLSGGQRQRIAIARAMLKDAPVLLLDEATSALDSESEVLIQKALWKLMEGRTAIVIAHRLSTIQKMDRIIVLDNGKIVEQGSHKQLIKNNQTYSKLWAHQSGGFIEE
jgi:ATP-binding cassette subfamily B protein